MKPELLTNRDAAITTHEENVRARAYELYDLNPAHLQPWKYNNKAILRAFCATGGVSC